MDRQRQRVEAQILERYFPRRFAFVGLGGTNPYVDLGLQSNSKKVYRFKILLESFPFSLPQVYISYPKNLKDYNGELLTSIGTSHAMHLLSPNDGMPQVCHFKDEHWNQNRTIYNISLKLRVWMEAYESHLRSGLPLDHFVSS